MIIVIPIEIKIREFIPKLFLTYQILKKTNSKVLFAGQRFISTKIKEFKNVIYLDKCTHYSRLLENPYNLSENIVCMLDEEGPVSFFDNDTLHIHYNKKIDKIINHFFFWGKKDLLKLKKKKFLKNKTFVFGHPKYDILNKRYIKIFDSQINKIKKKYNKFVFFAASFDSDPDLNLQTLKSQYKTYFSNLSDKKIDIKIKNNIKIRKISQKNYFKTVEMLCSLARRNPNINVVFRKHPYEDAEDVLRRFKNKPKNLHLVYEFNITPWIIASHIYVHGGCTTALEASILKKKIIMFKPFKDNTLRESELIKLGEHFSNINQCIKVIEKNLNIVENKKSNHIKKLIQNNNSNSFFYKKFIQYISKFKNLDSKIIYFPKENKFNEFLQKLKNILFIILSLIKNLILKTKIAGYLPEKHSFSKKDSLNKFKIIEKNELIKYFELFKKIEKDKINIKIKKLDKNIYLINK